MVRCGGSPSPESGYLSLEVFALGRNEFPIRMPAKISPWRAQHVGATEGILGVTRTVGFDAVNFFRLAVRRERWQLGIIIGGMGHRWFGAENPQECQGADAPFINAKTYPAFRHLIGLIGVCRCNFNNGLVSGNSNSDCRHLRAD